MDLVTQNPPRVIRQRGNARIIDTRDGTIERVVALGPTVQAAHREAFSRALAECVERNAREAYPRFVADFVRPE